MSIRSSITITLPTALPHRHSDPAILRSADAKRRPKSEGGVFTDFSKPCLETNPILRSVNVLDNMLRETPKNPLPGRRRDSLQFTGTTTANPPTTAPDIKWQVLRSILTPGSRKTRILRFDRPFDRQGPPCSQPPAAGVYNRSRPGQTATLDSGVGLGPPPLSGGPHRQPANRQPVTENGGRSPAFWASHHFAVRPLLVSPENPLSSRACPMSDPNLFQGRHNIAWGNLSHRFMVSTIRSRSHRLREPSSATNIRTWTSLPAPPLLPPWGQRKNPPLDFGSARLNGNDFFQVESGGNYFRRPRKPAGRPVGSPAPRFSPGTTSANKQVLIQAGDFPR